MNIMNIMNIKKFAVKKMGYFRKRSVFAIVLLLPAFLLITAAAGGGEARAVKKLLDTGGCRPQVSNYRLMKNFLKSTGANFTSMNISGWGEENGPALKETLAVVAGRLGAEEPAGRVEAWTNPCAGGFKLRADTSCGDRVSVLGQTLLTGGGDFLTVSFTTRDESRLQTAEGELHKLFEDGQVFITVCGVLERPLSSAEMLAEAENLLSKAGANEVEKTTAGYLVSVTGHTGQLPGGLYYAGRKVNLNIAFRCNPAEQKTYIYIATPLIFIEY